MAGFRIEGNTSGNVAEVDANNNMKVTLPSSVSQAGYTMLSGRISESTDPAGLLQEALRVSTQGRLTVGQAVCLHQDTFNYIAVDSAKYTVPVTTFTITFASGTANLNAGAVTTASAVARLGTYQYFPIYSDFATYATFDMSFSVAPQANTTVEAGFITCTGTTAPTDGAFFRFDSTATLKAVLNNNGTEYTSAALTAPSAAVMHKYKVILENDRALYYIDGACVAIISAPTGLGMPTYQGASPFTVRTYHAASVPALASVIKVGYVFVGLQDAAGLGKDIATISTGGGKTGAQGQQGHTVGSTALLTNSLAAGAGAAMTNTTAALGAGLGGQFAALPTLTVGTDGIVCSYLNPLATANITGKTLYIRGVKVHSGVTTILAGGPVLYEYSLAFGHTALSLATTEAVAAKAPRRIPLGLESFVATAAVGTRGSDSGVQTFFNAPIAINPGEYVAVVAKNLGVVTTTGVILFTVQFDAFWE